MATLTIKNLPDELYAALTRTAKKNRRSINNEAIISVERGLDSDGPDAQEDLLKRIRTNREDLARKGVYLSDDILAQSRTELMRRPTPTIDLLTRKGKTTRSKGRDRGK